MTKSILNLYKNIVNYTTSLINCCVPDAKILNNLSLLLKFDRNINEDGGFIDNHVNELMDLMENKYNSNDFRKFLLWKLTKLSLLQTEKLSLFIELYDLFQHEQFIKNGYSMSKIFDCNKICALLLMVLDNEYEKIICNTHEDKIAEVNYNKLFDISFGLREFRFMINDKLFLNSIRSFLLIEFLCATKLDCLNCDISIELEWMSYHENVSLFCNEAQPYWHTKLIQVINKYLKIIADRKSSQSTSNNNSYADKVNNVNQSLKSPVFDSNSFESNSSSSELTLFNNMQVKESQGARKKRLKNKL